MGERERLAHQLRAIVTVYEAELRGGHHGALPAIRARSRALLGDLETALEPYPDLRAAADAISQTLRYGEKSDGLREETVDRPPSRLRR